jgi:hypothetical protein
MTFNDLTVRAPRSFTGMAHQTTMPRLDPKRMHRQAHNKAIARLCPQAQVVLGAGPRIVPPCRRPQPSALCWDPLIGPAYARRATGTRIAVRARVGGGSPPHGAVAGDRRGRLDRHVAVRNWASRHFHDPVRVKPV